MLTFQVRYWQAQCLNILEFWIIWCLCFRNHLTESIELNEAQWREIFKNMETLLIGCVVMELSICNILYICNWSLKLLSSPCFWWFLMIKPRINLLCLFCISAESEKFFPVMLKEKNKPVSYLFNHHCNYSYPPVELIWESAPQGWRNYFLLKDWFIETSLILWFHKKYITQRLSNKTFCKTF